LNVWLAEKAGSPVDREVYGVFSSAELAKRACQDVADQYFGKRNTPALKWLGDYGYSSASYHQPVTGMWLFQVTRFTVDEMVS
jgi:hypothetical protein